MKFLHLPSRPRYVAAALIALAVGIAQTKPKWAHVHETSEPYLHRIGAANEISETNGKSRYRVFPASLLGKGNRYQSGHDARHGRHDHQWPVVCGAQLSEAGHRLPPSSSATQRIRRRTPGARGGQGDG